MGTPTELTGPDLKQGVRDAEVGEGVPLLGHIDGQPAILVRDRGGVHAVGAKCTHYGGPLAEGIVDGGAIHCPWRRSAEGFSTVTSTSCTRGSSRTPRRCARRAPRQDGTASSRRPRGLAP